jgi:hypothetical protein
MRDRPVPRHQLLDRQRHPYFDPADAELHQSANLQQLETDGAERASGCY